VKTITITENAYKALKSRKGKKDSFSDVIVKMTGKSLDEFYGVLSKSSAEKLESAIRETRIIRNKLHSERRNRLV